MKDSNHRTSMPDHLSPGEYSAPERASRPDELSTGIGDSIIYIYQGHKEWEGTKDQVFSATNQRLNDFIFASDLLKKVKEEENHSSK